MSTLTRSQLESLCLEGHCPKCNSFFAMSFQVYYEDNEVLFSCNFCDWEETVNLAVARNSYFTWDMVSVNE